MEANPSAPGLCPQIGGRTLVPGKWVTSSIHEIVGPGDSVRSGWPDMLERSQRVTDGEGMVASRGHLVRPVCVFPSSDLSAQARTVEQQAVPSPGSFSGPAVWQCDIVTLPD